MREFGQMQVTWMGQKGIIHLSRITFVALEKHNPMKNKYVDLIEQTFDFPQEEFYVEQDELHWHDIPLMELIKQYGTPLKVTYLPKISERIFSAPSGCSMWPWPRWITKAVLTFVTVPRAHISNSSWKRL